MSEDVQTVEKTEEKKEDQILISEPEPTWEDTRTITREEAIKGGWTEAEIKRGEEQGFVSEPKKEEESADDVKKENADDAGKKAEIKKAEAEGGVKKEDVKPEEKKPAKKKGYELNEEEEQLFVNSFGPGHNVHGLYFGMKAQRNRAQKAETERDHLQMQLNEREKLVKGLEERVEKIERFGRDGDEGDLDEKPVTMKQLKEWQEEQEKKKSEKTNEDQKRNEVVRQAMRDQEDQAKIDYPDYDETVKMGTELIEKHLDKLEGPDRKKAYRLLHDLGAAAQRADKLTDDDFNACDIAYELGQLARKLLPETTSGGKAEVMPAKEETERSTRDLTPDERIVKNASRRGSSASISGKGGARYVSPNDITVDEINTMTSGQRMEFRKKHPEIWDRLVHG